MLVLTIVAAVALCVAVAAELVPTGWAYLAAAFAVAAVVHARRAALGFVPDPAQTVPRDDGARRDSALQMYAGSVARSLRTLYGKSCAFVLLAAPVGETPANVQYISNLDRAEGTDLLRGLFAKWQQQAQPFGKAAGSSRAASGETPTIAINAPTLLGSAWQVLEFAHDPVIIWQLDGAGILYWNRAAEALYGYSRDDVRGQVTHVLLKTVPSGDGILELEEKLARYGMWAGELAHTARDGSRVLVESRLSLVAQVDGKWLVLELNRDITDRAGAERGKRAAEQQLSALRRRLRAV
jgi:PAS domain S-box-containing protein